MARPALMERNWNVRASPQPSVAKEQLPPLSGRKARPSSTGSYRSRGSGSDREQLSARSDLSADYEPYRSGGEHVKRSNPKSSSSRADARSQPLVQPEYVYAHGGQVVRQDGADVSARKPARRPISAASGKSRTTDVDDPYYMFWLKQAHSGPVGAQKKSSSRPESAKSSRETDLEDVWVASKPALMPKYEPKEDKHLSAFFSRRPSARLPPQTSILHVLVACRITCTTLDCLCAPGCSLDRLSERMALEQVKKETLSAARRHTIPSPLWPRR